MELSTHLPASTTSPSPFLPSLLAYPSIRLSCIQTVTLQYPTVVFLLNQWAAGMIPVPGVTIVLFVLFYLFYSYSYFISFLFLFQFIYLISFVSSISFPCLIFISIPSHLRLHYLSTPSVQTPHLAPPLSPSLASTFCELGGFFYLEMVERDFPPPSSPLFPPLPPLPSPWRRRR